jgi:sugar transferase (PEP-CTERM/EpsH1 system associated)
MKPAFLFLCHRIPYPPNKGDKIRSFHLLKHLAESYRIFLGAFIDDPNDWNYTDKLHSWCEQTCLQKLEPQKAKLRSLKGFTNAQPLTLPYYYNSAMAQWVSSITSSEQIDHMLIYSSSMAQYILNPKFSSKNRIIDFVDVDSDKWRQYAEKKSWPMNWLYRREASYLLDFEKEVAATLDASFFVSSQEAEHFKQLAPESASNIHYYSNGVDLERFNPEQEFETPFDGGEQQIVFTGAMDYWPNEDAVSWFAKKVFVAIRQDWPKARFSIVGSRPSEKVQNLNEIEGVNVTGSVDDVRPYIKYASVVVAPMHIARGIQNKVLEAMAMAKPVVVTTMGLEGINAQHRIDVLIADTAEAFIREIDELFKNATGPTIGAAARNRVCKDFSWDKTLQEFDRWLA